MQTPLQITFRHLKPSPAIESRIRKEAERLEKFYDHITACRIVVEAPHRHHHQGQLYHIRIRLTVPGREIVASHESHEKHAHEDAYVAIRDAFDAVQRQLEDHVRLQRGKIKHHELPAHGRIKQLFPFEDYGVIETPEGREVYFHRNSVLEVAFEQLNEGADVRFVEEPGERGPQASSVRLSGKHHIVG